MFGLVSEAIAKVIPLATLRFIAFGHVESDECGAMNELLAAAPHAEVAHGALGCMVSLDDLCDRPPRKLADGEVIDLGGKRVRHIDTPHVPHNWEARVLFEETTKTLLCGDLFTHTGDGPALTFFNDGGKGDGSVTIDGGGKVTLSGNHQNRILYQSTCDETLHYTTSHCQNQPAPHLVVQNIAFTAGSASATSSVLGGGAIFVGGGTFKAFNVSITGSTQPNLEQDYAGGAIYTFEQATQPVYIVGSTFDSNTGCNGGALGSIGTSYAIFNSVFSGNKTLGNGENPAQAGTPGGGLGGAIYNDGDGYTLSLCGTLMSNNMAADLGSGSIFQVVDDLKWATSSIDQSTFNGQQQHRPPSRSS